ncbi:MAG: porin family protein [Acidobacteriota bacterium]
MTAVANLCLPWKKSLILPLVLSSAMGLVWPVAAEAQNTRRLELSGFVGGLSVSQDLGSVTNIFFTTTGEAEDVDFGQFFGFRASFLFSSYLGIEGSLTRGENSYTFSVNDNELGAVSLGEQFDADQLHFGGNVIVQVPFASGLVPYGTVGIGSVRTEPQNPISDIDDVTSTDFTVGGGVKYFIADSAFGVRFDIRHHIVSEGLTFSGTSDSPRNTEFTIGGVVRFF